MALHSYLRLATSASLIALGGIAGIGALSLLLPLPSDTEKKIVAQSDAAEAATPCSEQSWWRLDRTCLTRRDLPWMSGQGGPSTATFQPARPADKSPSQLAESQGAPTTPPAAQKPVPQKPAAPSAMPPAAAPSEPTQGNNVTIPALPPAATERKPPKRTVEVQDDGTPPPTRWRSVRRPAAKPRPVASTTSGDEEREPAPKKTFRRERAAKTPPRVAAKPSSKVVAEDEAEDTPKRARKPSNRNALNAVRRFGDSLPDVPIDAYAGDGTRRKVIIRPTSIQDYYYYSVPR
jgi:hypothetical protein